MSAIYDNWERLVAAVLKKEQLWQLFHEQSRSPSITSASSDFSFSCLNSSLDDVPFSFSGPECILGNDDKSPVENFSSNKNVTLRDLTIEVPKLRIQESHPLPLPPAAISNPSYPNSAPISPSPPLHSPEQAENVKTSWKKGKLIGTGPFGGVYLGFNSENGQMCAIKEVSLSSKDAELKRNERMLQKDIAVLSRMNHPNIVQYYGSEMVADNFYIYLEYMSGGSLHMILQQYGRLGESAIRSYTQQILSGLAYLHSKHIAHRDIRGVNILVDPNGRAKLANFGIENHIAERLGMLWFVGGSRYWMAPELIMNPNLHNLAIDIWSLGCTVLEMATSKPPLSQYDTGTAMFKIANHIELPTFPDHLSDVCIDFLRQCWQWNPLHRPTARQLLGHPFVRISSPLSSGHPPVSNAVNSEGTDHGTNPHQLDSRKVVFSSSGASKSNFQLSDIYTPRNISAPFLQLGVLFHS